MLELASQLAPKSNLFVKTSAKSRALQTRLAVGGCLAHCSRAALRTLSGRKSLNSPANQISASTKRLKTADKKLLFYRVCSFFAIDAVSVRLSIVVGLRVALLCGAKLAQTDTKQCKFERQIKSQQREKRSFCLSALFDSTWNLQVAKFALFALLSFDF